MKLENIFLITPPIGVIAGLIAYFAFDLPYETSLKIAASIALFPHGLMAIACLMVVIFYGGFNPNNYPPCTCGNRQYDFDGPLTKQRNEQRLPDTDYEWYYHCLKCGLTWAASGGVFYRLEAIGLIPCWRRNRWNRWKPYT